MKNSMITAALLLTIAALGCEDSDPAEPPAVGSPPAAAETPAAETAEAAEASDDGALACDAFVAHMVRISTSLGDEAFITSENEAQWVGACEAAGDLNEPDNATIARCYMEHDDLASADSCGNPRFMNRWASHM
jgi:hypothetical protein